MNNLVAFVLVFGVTVLFHELGHFLVGKASGILVREFAIGFGPALARLRRGETAYSLRLLPLGGFVRFAGMDPAQKEAGEVALEEDDARSFNNRPLWMRAATVAAGPVMNFLLAVAFFGLFGIYAAPTVLRVLPDSPAQAAGLQAGDRFLEVAGQPTFFDGDVIEAVEAHAGQPVALVVQREGRVFELTAVPRPVEVPVGPPAPGSEGQQAVAVVGRLDVEFASRFGAARRSLLEGLAFGWHQTVQGIRDLVGLLAGVFAGRTKAEVMGPVGIWGVVGTAGERGLPYLVLIAAILNLNLGLLNLLPVPVLDGGWLMFLGLEAVRRRPLAPEQRGLAQMIGLALLMALAIFATVMDLRRLVSS